MKPGNFIHTILIFLPILLLSGCGKPSFVAHSDIDRTVDFSQYSTFTIAELPPGADDEILNNSIVRKRIKLYVAKELILKGYREVETGGDLLVRANKVYIEEQDEETHSGTGMSMGYRAGPWGWEAPKGYGWGKPIWMSQIPSSQVREFTEGQVIVNVYDYSKKDLIWQGWSSGEVRSYNNTMKNRDEAVKIKVKRIMADFPKINSQTGNTVQQ